MISVDIYPIKDRGVENRLRQIAKLEFEGDYNGSGCDLSTMKRDMGLTFPDKDKAEAYIAEVKKRFPRWKMNFTIQTPDDIIFEMNVNPK